MGTACNFTVKIKNKITKSLFTVGLRIHQAGLLTRFTASPNLPNMYISGINWFSSPLQ